MTVPFAENTTYRSNDFYPRKSPQVAGNSSFEARPSYHRQNDDRFDGGFRSRNNYSNGPAPGFESAEPMVPSRGGGDWGKKMRQVHQETLKFKKSSRDTDFFWSMQASNVQQDRVRGGPPQKSKRRLDEEEEELFKDHTGVVGINFDKYDHIPVERIGEGVEDIPVIETFQEIFRVFKMPEFVEQNVGLLKYIKPTPVQKYALPAGLCGRDLMCCAQTGSGKTATFICPVVGILDQSTAIENVQTTFEGPALPRAVILAPTRELCSQITNEANKFCHRSPFRVVQIYGGVEARPQMAQLARGCDILTATPGRLIDFVDRGVISLSNVQILILDEADRMLDMGFEPQIRQIVEERDMPRQRQTMLFSATFPKEIQKLAQDFLFNYIWIAVGQVGGAAESVTQSFIKTRPEDKPQLCLEILADRLNIAKDITIPGLTQQPLQPQQQGTRHEQTLIFVSRKRTASQLTNYLARHKITAAEIHGDLSQSERERALAMFRSKQVSILVATDVAARGLDIPAVAHVMNFDLPGSIDDYVHRIGRTGRIGNTGVATSFYVSEFDANGDGMVSNSGILKDLVNILEMANNEVPAFMVDELFAKGNRRPGNNNFNKHKFGGRDVRQGNFTAQTQPMHQQPSQVQHVPHPPHQSSYDRQPLDRRAINAAADTQGSRSYQQSYRDNQYDHQERPQQYQRNRQQYRPQGAEDRRQNNKNF